MQCPRCFWLDVRLKITRRASPPFNINSLPTSCSGASSTCATAARLSFAIIMQEYSSRRSRSRTNQGSGAENFVGVQAAAHRHQPTRIAVDDSRVNQDGKHRRRLQSDQQSKDVSIDSDWQMSYKRQMEVYQWLLLRQMAFRRPIPVISVYTNGRMDGYGFIINRNSGIQTHTVRRRDLWVSQHYRSYEKMHGQ